MPGVVDITIQALDKTKGAVDSANDNFEGLGKTASAGMAVAAGAVAGLGLAVAAVGAKFAEAMDIDAGRDKLAAQLGLTAEQSEHFGRVAGSLYAGAYGESLDEVNEAIRYVTTNIAEGVGESEGALEAATAKVLDFSAAFGEELGPTTRAVGVMIKSGIAKDATEALDILTVGMQNGANSAEDLLDTFTEYPTQFRELGISGQMSMGLISQALKAGARDSDTAADAIKEFAIRSKDGSKLSAESFQAIGLNAQQMTAVFAKGGPEAEKAMKLVIDRLREMKDPVAQDAAAVGLFGTKAEDLQDALYAMDPTTAVASLGQIEGAASRMGTTLADNAKTKLEAFKRGIQQNVSDFMTNTVLPAVVGLAEQAAPKLAEFGDNAKKAFEWATGKPEIVAAISTAVGVTLVGAFVALGIAAWGAAAGVIAATWPIVAIAAAIGGLVALLVLAYNNWDTFRNVVQAVVGFITTNAPAAFEMIKAAVITFYEAALAPLIGYIQQNSEAFGNIGKVLLVVAGIIVGTVVVSIVAMITMMVALAAAGAVIITAIVAVVAVLYNLGQVLWDVFNNIRDWVGNVTAIFWDLVQNIARAIADAAGWVWNIVTAVARVAAAVGQKIDEVASFFWGLPGRILSAIGDLGSLLWDSGARIIEGLLNGIRSKIDSVRNLLSSVTNLIPSWKGPPEVDKRLLRPSGQMVMAGFMRGITDQLPALKATLGGVTTSMPAAVGAGASGGGMGGTVTFTGNTSDAFAAAFMQLVRSGKIQLSGTF